MGISTIANGANLDDLGDYRPGLQAASDFEVRSPLADCEFTKSDVRELAQHWQLSVHDKPATPCLSSRIAYGEEVTPARLRMVDQAEQFLREQGLGELRVRFHAGDLARIEVNPEAIARIGQPTTRNAITKIFRELGFKFVTLDLVGFQSGSLNAMVPIEALTQVDRK